MALLRDNLLKPKVHYSLISLIGLIMYLPTLQYRRLRMWDEAIYATASTYMIEGYWLIPHSPWGDRGIAPFLHKPPLFEWLMAASMSVFGQNLFAIRLSSTLMGIGVALLCYRIGSDILDWRAGLASGLFLLASPAWWTSTYSARTAEMETTLIFFGSVFVWALFWHNTNRRIMIAGGIAGAAAVMTKGVGAGVFLAIVLPVMAVTAREYLQKDVFIGSVAGLGTVLPWPVYTFSTVPNAAKRYLIDRQLRRSSGALGSQTGLLPTANHPYFQTMFTSPRFVPVTYIAIIGGTVAYLAGISRRDLSKIAWWTIAPPVFYSLVGGNMEHYILPIVVPMAVLSGLGITSLINVWNQRSSSRFQLTPATITTVFISLTVIILLSQLVLPGTVASERPQERIGNSITEDMPEGHIYAYTEDSQFYYVLEFYSNRAVQRVDKDKIESERPNLIVLRPSESPPSGYSILQEENELILYQKDSSL